METDTRDPDDLALQLLGPVVVRRGGVVRPLPASRKVRALLGYLALASQPVPRSRLCELLWDVPNDPRGELRWCLSKLRGLVETPALRRVITDRDSVRLDLPPRAVDAVELLRACDAGLSGLSSHQLRALLPPRNADLLEGSEVDSPAFDGWLVAQRRRLRDCQAAVLAELVKRLPAQAQFDCLDRWRELAPHEPQVHEALLAALAQSGRVREAEEHLAAACRSFEAHALDPRPLRDAWHSIRARASQPDAAGRALADPAPADAESGRFAHAWPAADSIAREPGPRRASIAVMPFTEGALHAADAGELGDALAHDVISGLAQLRSLFVIAHATMFALHQRGVAPDQAGRLLAVDYVVTGALRKRAARLSVRVELVETARARIVWTDAFELATREASQLPAEIGHQIVAALASEVDTSEQARALLRPPELLDAWQAHQRGLWHMYRFSQADNQRAQQFFERAIGLDPTFARAHAGLSFTHWQDAFQGWAERQSAIERAYAAAQRGLSMDDRDPASHVALGRTLWLQAHPDRALGELTRAVELSPSFAMGHYTLAFVQAQGGDAQCAVHAADLSHRLSPYDPLVFGMLGSRAMALVRLGRYREAADCAVQAAARPNAHAHIRAIAVYSLVLAGALAEARAQAALLQSQRPGYAIADFLATFRLDETTAAHFRAAAVRLAAQSG